MAVRPQHVQDGGIAERRLRPIYDWLDIANNKKALQEADKVLKKSPTLQAARALKALALFRLGKTSEAFVILDVLTEEKPSDDTTLQAMTITYRESQQLSKVCALYEAAVKVEPSSEELYSHLFMSYVRVGDYRAQQRAAMALYKFAPKNPYYFWAVMSIVLQAKESNDNTKKGILLALAQRMVDNFITENKMEAEQEARLYIMILDLQDKWEDSLKFIESPLYSKLVPGSSVQACIPYLKQLGKWRKLNTICKELLYDNIDRWDYYLPYFDSVFHLMNKTDNTDSESSGDDKADDTVEKCHEFICQLVESMPSGMNLRGPYLARLELWKRLHESQGDPTAIMGCGLALCIQYLMVFAHKPCAVPDLRPFIPMLSLKLREENCRNFLTCLGFDEDSEPDTSDDIQRHVSCLSAWRLTSPSATTDEYMALAERLRDHYLRCLSQGLVTATVTEFCAADGYGLLAAHQYFNAAIKLQETQPIYEALCLLQMVLQHSPSNFHAKLLLIQFYHIMGNALAADTIYQKLEAKHIQLVSLGWLHAARLAPAAASSRALQLLADTRTFHTHHAKDSVEHLTYAYKYGTFEKLVALYAWRRRLEACAWCALAARERALLALLAGPPAPLHAPPRLPRAPTDNRDLNLIVNWEPPEAQPVDLKDRTFEEDIAYLRLKDGLVSALALCIETADNRPLEEKRQQYDELSTCIDAFGLAMDKCKEIYSNQERISISAPFPSRIVAFVSSPVGYRELYCTWLRMVWSLCGGARPAARALCERAAARTAAALRRLPPPPIAYTPHATPPADFLEFIGIITFLLGVCNELVSPPQGKKNKKKTTQSPDELQTIESLVKLNETVQQSISDLENMFENWPEYDFESNFHEALSKFNISANENDVMCRLKNGRDEMLNDVKNILGKKTKYLKTLFQ